jgi:hypothetical protein
MTAESVVHLLWLGGVALVATLLILAYRARKRGGAYKGAVIGTMYEWQSHDKRRALELIVEDRAEERRGEHRDGNLPDLESPK